MTLWLAAYLRACPLAMQCDILTAALCNGVDEMNDSALDMLSVLTYGWARRGYSFHNSLEKGLKPRSSHGQRIGNPNPEPQGPTK
jgi:hypothetical protein